MRNFALMVLAAVWFVAPAHAGVLYEQALLPDGSNTTGGNNPFSSVNRHGAENFTLTETSTVTSIVFNAYHSTGSVLSTDWSIRTDLAGLPGTILASGNAAPTETFIVNKFSYQLIDYSIDIADIVLGAGNYWVTFHNNVSQVGDPHWTILNSGGDGLSAISSDGGNTWGNPYPGTNMAFRIEGTSGGADPVPAPGALVLVGFGLVALGARRRIA